MRKQDKKDDKFGRRDREKEYLEPIQWTGLLKKHMMKTEINRYILYSRVRVGRGRCANTSRISQKVIDGPMDELTNGRTDHQGNLRGRARTRGEEK